ncbi:MAG: DUF2207 domain-containing protein [Lachnospira sp.]|nr:DUF2207 domain-containing protein [Lachnospira sp.]
MEQKKVKKIILIVFIVFFLLNFLSPLIMGLVFSVVANKAFESASIEAVNEATLESNDSDDNNEVPSESVTKPVTRPQTPQIVYESYPYYITNYDVNIEVSEDRVLYITETINTFFFEPRHGIIRNIPLRATIRRADNTKSYMRAKIKDINVNNAFSLSNQNGNKVIQIGLPDTTIIGPESYTITYTYDMGNDPLKDLDELYFNIIGTEWDTVISNATFTIKMPKDFDADKLGFSTGTEGSIGHSNLEYEVNGRTITGYTTADLNSFEGISIRLELPEDYFTETVDYFGLIQRAVPLAAILIGFVLWAIWGRDTKYVAPISFYPPNGYNSAELGMIYRGKAGNKEVISLLVYLANQGYWDIEEIEKQGLFSSHKTFKITFKKKNYTGNNFVERDFFHGLYKLASYDDDTQQKYVTEDNLTNKFYITANKIIKDLNSKTNRATLFEKKKILPYTLLILSMMATYVFGFIIPAYHYHGELTLVLFTNLFTIIAIIVFLNLFKPKEGNIVTNLFAIVWSLGFGGIPFCITIIPAVIGMGKLDIALTSVAALIILIIIYKFMPKRTPKGVQLLGEIEGFKTFLKTAEKARLEALVMEDPNYFYNILPYTYVLDVSDKWIEQFEGIVYDAPEWYHGVGAFSTVTFSSFMSHTMSTASSSMTSSPSSSSGGSGSSGGGSSGGGGGGGGGSSW